MYFLAPNIFFIKIRIGAAAFIFNLSAFAIVAFTTASSAFAQDALTASERSLQSLSAGPCLSPVLTKCEVLQRQTAEQITDCLGQTVLKTAASSESGFEACRAYERSELMKSRVGSAPNTGLLACLRDIDKLELSHQLPSSELVKQMKTKTASISATCRKSLNFDDLEVARPVARKAPKATLKPKAK